jgi:hypothetical protein
MRHFITIASVAAELGARCRVDTGKHMVVFVWNSFLVTPYLSLSPSRYLSLRPMLDLISTSP